MDINKIKQPLDMNPIIEQVEKKYKGEIDEKKEKVLMLSLEKIDRSLEVMYASQNKQSIRFLLISIISSAFFSFIVTDSDLYRILALIFGCSAIIWFIVTILNDKRKSKLANERAMKKWAALGRDKKIMEDIIKNAVIKY